MVITAMGTKAEIDSKISQIQDQMVAHFASQYRVFITKSDVAVIVAAARRRLAVIARRLQTPKVMLTIAITLPENTPTSGATSKTELESSLSSAVGFAAVQSSLSAVGVTITALRIQVAIPVSSGDDSTVAIAAGAAGGVAAVVLLSLAVWFAKKKPVEKMPGVEVKKVQHQDCSSSSSPSAPAPPQYSQSLPV